MRGALQFEPCAPLDSHSRPACGDRLGRPRCHPAWTTSDARPHKSEARTDLGDDGFSRRLRSFATFAATGYAKRAFLNESSAFAESCFSGHKASSMAGLLRTPGRPIRSAHMLPVSCQSLWICGRMTTLRPIKLPIPAIELTAGKSGGHCIRSVTSATQGRNFSGGSPSRFASRSLATPTLVER
jgi:hypothetical protein